MSQLPEFWVTNVAKALAGDQPCLLSVWLPGRTYIKRQPRDPAQQALWNAQHSEQLLSTQDWLASQGARTIMKEHYFKMAGRVSKLAGKIDLIGVFASDDASNRDLWRVVDCKGATPNDTHVVQVMMYMAVLPHILPKAKLAVIDGRVVYPTHTVEITHDQALAFAPKLWAMMARLGDGDKPSASPSRDACRFCDIPESLCTERHVEPPDIETDLF
jgi:hypothetical protein